MKLLTTDVNKKRANTSGFTLIEVVVVLTIIGILTTASTFMMTNIIAKSSLESAASAIYSDLRFAQSEAVKLNKPVYVSFVTENNQWCYGMSTENSCDCFEADDCTLNGDEKIRTNDFFKEVDLDKAAFAGRKNYTVFDHRTGFSPGKNGSIWLSKNDLQMAVIVNRLGRIRFCSPTIEEYSQQCPKNPRDNI